MPTTLTIFHGKLQLEEGTYVTATTFLIQRFCYSQGQVSVGCVVLYAILTPHPGGILGGEVACQAIIRCERVQKARQIQTRALFGGSLWLLTCSLLTVFLPAFPWGRLYGVM